MPIFAVLGTAGTAGAASAAGAAASQGAQTQDQLQKGMDLAGGSPQQAAQQTTPLFQNLAEANNLQGPTASGVPLSTATQANLMGNQTDFNAQQGGTSAGNLFSALATSTAKQAGPGDKGVPQIDSSFMNTPMMMAQPQMDTAMSRAQTPQDMLLQLLQQQIKR